MLLCFKGLLLNHQDYISLMYTYVQHLILFQLTIFVAFKYLKLLLKNKYLKY